MVAATETVPPPIAAALEPGEHLVWWDRPKQGLCFRPRDSARIPFSLVWGGAAAFIFVKASVDTANPVVIAVTGLFFLTGVYLMFGRFVHDIWRRSRLVYGLTDRRVLILSPAGVTSLDIEGLAQMDTERSRGGYGSISFGGYPGTYRRSQFGMWYGQPSVPTFEFIREHERVFQEIRRLRKAAEDAG